jgi:hypothetical protein
MTDQEKAKTIYALLIPKGSGRNIPSFEELAAYVSKASQFSFRLKTGEKKVKIDAQLTVRRHDNKEKELADMEQNFNIALFLFLLAAASAGVYGLWRVFGAKNGESGNHKPASPQSGNETQNRTAAPGQKQTVWAGKYLLLAVAIEKLFPPFSDRGAGPIQNKGRELYDSSPLLLADQTEEQKTAIEKHVSQTKPEQGYAILAVQISAGGAMTGFQKGRGSSVQREAFEKLSGETLSVLGFCKELPDGFAFYDIG